MEAEQAYATLAERLNFPQSKALGDILRYLMTPVQARLAVELPAPPEELAEKVGLDLPAVKAELHDMFVKGVIFPRDAWKEEGFRFARAVVQIHDGAESRGGWNPKADPKLGELWEAFSKAEWYPSRRATPPLAVPIDRVIPAYRAMPPEIKLEPWEDVRVVLKEASQIAVTACACRNQRLAVNQDCKFSRAEVCLQFDRSADYTLARGSGRKITHDEALEIVDYAEQHGLIHSTFRNAKVTNANVMCNCCFDCCGAFQVYTTGGLSIAPRMAKSRYQAVIDAKACNGCEMCQPYCGWGAISMVDGKAVLDPEKCWGCGVCVLQCPAEAMTMKLVRPPEWVPDFLPARTTGTSA